MRVVLSAFKQSEEALKTRRGSSDLSDDLRLRVADEILTLVDLGERSPQRILESVSGQVRNPRRWSGVMEMPQRTIVTRKRCISSGAKAAVTPVGPSFLVKVFL